MIIYRIVRHDQTDQINERRVQLLAMVDTSVRHVGRSNRGEVGPELFRRVDAIEDAEPIFRNNASRLLHLEKVIGGVEALKPLGVATAPASVAEVLLLGQHFPLRVREAFL